MFIHMDINKYIFTLRPSTFLILRQRRRKDGLLPFKVVGTAFMNRKKTIFPINIYLMVHYHTKERGDIVCACLSNLETILMILTFLFSNKSKDPTLKGEAQASLPIQIFSVV